MAKKEAAKVQDSKAVELPTAKELMKQIAQQEAEKASEYVRREAAAEREKKALMERLGKASGLSDEEALRRAIVIIQRASSNGLTEVQVLRFPNSLGTDGGRAINNLEKKHPNRASQGDVPVLGSAVASKGIPAALPDRGFSQRHARGRRHNIKLGRQVIGPRLTGAGAG
jgi:hypothetical protein